MKQGSSRNTGFERRILVLGVAGIFVIRTFQFSLFFIHEIVDFVNDRVNFCYSLFSNNVLSCPPQFPPNNILEIN